MSITGKLQNTFFVFSVCLQFTDYTAFNTAIAQLITNNHLSLYSVPHTCFGLRLIIFLCFETSMLSLQHVGGT